VNISVVAALAPGTVASAGTVIVGAGMCGGNAAVTLREEGYRNRVVLIGDEPAPPF
jgi:3-phenylpropionate/trans-cinnamate dioxygenase ferredoxin reductase subunit